MCALGRDVLLDSLPLSLHGCLQHERAINKEEETKDGFEAMGRVYNVALALFCSIGALRLFSRAVLMSPRPGLALFRRTPLTVLAVLLWIRFLLVRVSPRLRVLCL